MKEMMTAISFMRDIPTQRVTSFLILMMREIRYPKSLKKNRFSEPVDFKANISFSGGEAQSKEYGFDTADFDAILLTDRNTLPIQKVTLSGLIASLHTHLTVLLMKHQQTSRL